MWVSLVSALGGGFSISLILPNPRVRQECPKEMLLGVSAQIAFAAKYVKAFGLWFSAQNVPMFSFGGRSVSVDTVRR